MQAGTEPDIGELCRRAIRQRIRLDAAFPELSLGDPAWNILLELRLARADRSHGRGALPVSAVGLLTGVPATTVLRHLDRLHRAGLVSRSRDERDRRRVFVGLTDRCVDRLDPALLADPAFGR